MMAKLLAPTSWLTFVNGAAEPTNKTSTLSEIRFRPDKGHAVETSDGACPSVRVDNPPGTVTDCMVEVTLTKPDGTPSDHKLKEWKSAPRDSLYLSLDNSIATMKKVNLISSLKKDKSAASEHQRPRDMSTSAAPSQSQQDKSEEANARHVVVLVFQLVDNGRQALPWCAPAFLTIYDTQKFGTPNIRDFSPRVVCARGGDVMLLLKDCGTNLLNGAKLFIHYSYLDGEWTDAEEIPERFKYPANVSVEICCPPIPASVIGKKLMLKMQLMTERGTFSDIADMAYKACGCCHVADLGDTTDATPVFELLQGPEELAVAQSPEDYDSDGELYPPATKRRKRASGTRPAQPSTSSTVARDAANPTTKETLTSKSNDGILGDVVKDDILAKAALYSGFYQLSDDAISCTDETKGGAASSAQNSQEVLDEDISENLDISDVTLSITKKDLLQQSEAATMQDLDLSCLSGLLHDKGRLPSPSSALRDSLWEGEGVGDCAQEMYDMYVKPSENTRPGRGHSSALGLSSSEVQGRSSMCSVKTIDK